MKNSVLFTLFAMFVSSISGTNEDCTNNNTVTWGDNCYATIDWTDPNEYYLGCQDDYLEVPNGWQLADYEDGIIDFIFNYEWGTHVVVLSNGDSYGTANYYPGLWNSAMLLNDGLGGYKPASCSLRIFISRSTGPQPSSTPTSRPTSEPTSEPTPRPTTEPTSEPTSRPTSNPTSRPTLRPTGIPTIYPTSFPTIYPTTVPIPAPSQFPTSRPTHYPSTIPTSIPSSIPTSGPTSIPSSIPTPGPTSIPISAPTSTPTVTSSERKLNISLYSIIYHWGIITFLIIISSCMVFTCLGCLCYTRRRFEANERNTSYSQTPSVRTQEPVAQEPVVIGEIQLSERSLENNIVLI